MANDQVIQWLDQPEDKDYPAAASYLTLLWPESRAQDLVRQLQAAALTRFKAKDIFRASGLSLLGVSNSHVEKDKEDPKRKARVPHPPGSRAFPGQSGGCGRQPQAMCRVLHQRGRVDSLQDCVTRNFIFIL